MLTPKDIAEKTFDRTLGFGYRMDAVDEYLEQASAALQEQLDINADLNKKLEILAEKLTAYRNDEDSLRAAVLGAQKLGDSVIRESKTKADIIMRNANAKAEAIVSNARRQIESEQDAFEKLQNEVSSFKDRLVEIYGAHLELIRTIPGRVQSPKDAAEAAERAIDEAPEQEEPTTAAAEQPAQPTPDSEAEDISFTPAGSAAADADKPDDVIEFDDDDDDDDAPFTSAKFGELRFGDAFRLDHQ